MARSSAYKEQLTEESTKVERLLMKREKSTGQKQILAEHPDGLEKSEFCDLRKRVCQKGKVSLWKRAGCQTESKALEFV